MSRSMLKIRHFYTVLLFGISMISVGCDKAKPELSSMGTLSGFSVNESTIPVAATGTTPVTVNGLCHKRYTDIEISMDNGVTWKTVREVATSSEFKCDSTASFKLVFNFPASQLNASKSATYYFRGSAETGFSDSKAVLLSAAVNSSDGIITGGSAGGGASSAGNYKLQGRIRPLSSGTILSTTNYKLRGKLTAQ